ncbi:hypothetical protein [Paenarthrobacter nicotinovorans]|uniref:hypothetical protein n=1 Tax=Paenarthrobacter nicotinovorans TaxID=29320 RepID=UPI0011A1D6B6|nr:hypothetical protein [Paenarthrobacter nicotinovorans]
MPKRPNPAVKIAQETAHNAVFDAEGNTKPGVHNVLLKAVEVQRPLVLANLRRLQRRYPNDSPAQLASKLERHYLTAVAGGGAGVGAIAVVPGLGTAASLGLSALATVGFLETTALYASSLAELHGIRLTDPERARTMVMAIMLGEEGTSLLGALSGQSLGRGKGVTNAWGKTLTRKIPGSGFGVVRDAIQRAFLKNLIKKQGTAFLGRALPFGVGAVVGGAGNMMMGRAVVATAKEAFGPLPDTIPGELLPKARKNVLENPTSEGDNSGFER